jgi:hypothetical protein
MQVQQGGAMIQRIFTTPRFLALFVLAVAFISIGAVPKEERVPLLVRLSCEANRTEVRAEVESRGGTIRYEYRLQPDLIAIRDFPAGAVPHLENLPGVVKVMEDRRVRGHLAESVPLMRADSASMSGYSDGSGVTVCVLDTGINKSHPALAGAITSEYDFVNNDSDATDDEGHGTHVAGIIVSRDAVHTGVAPGASLAIAKVLDDTGQGYDSDIIAGIEWCTLAVGAEVINQSLGGTAWPGSCDFDALAEMVNRSVDHGVVNVIASGNEADPSSITVPACASRAIAVGSVYDADIGPTSFPACSDPATAPDQIACYSNGSTALDLMAPGSEITSTAMDGGFTSDHGTTLSAPHVAGLAARLIGEHPEYIPEDVHRILAQTAVDLELPGFDDRSGHGRVDAVRAMSEPLAVVCGAPPDCEDLDICTEDICTGGYCAWRPLCDDIDACTEDICTDGTCTYNPVPVDDGLECTTDSCDPCLGVHHEPTGTCNSVCTDAITLRVGQTAPGDTSTASADYDAPCTGGPPQTGPDLAYRLDLEAFEHVRIRLDSGTDMGMYVLAEAPGGGDCDPVRCFTGSDTNPGPGAEIIPAFTPPYEGTYYLVVDSALAPGGPFDLAVEPVCFVNEQGRPCNDHDNCTSDETCQGTVCAIPGPGQVPDGANLPGIQLTIAKSELVPGELELAWGASCGASADDYAVYEGDLHVWYDHRYIQCSTAGALTASIEPGPESHYYLVVPLDPVHEGSYGRDSERFLRPPSPDPCRPVMHPEPCPRVD